MSSDEDSLRIEVKPSDSDTVIVKLAGSANMDIASELRDRLTSLLTPSTRRLILDISELEFINSSGLGGIVAAHLRCRRTDGEIRLVSPRPNIRTLLQITKLTNLFPIHESVESAKRA